MNPIIKLILFGSVLVVAAFGSKLKTLIRKEGVDGPEKEGSEGKKEALEEGTIENKSSPGLKEGNEASKEGQKEEGQIVEKLYKLRDGRVIKRYYNTKTKKLVKKP